MEKMSNSSKRRHSSPSGEFDVILVVVGRFEEKKKVGKVCDIIKTILDP